LLVSELTGVFAKKAMKTAEGKNPNRWATMPGNRAHGAEGQNRSCSIKWAEKAENFSRGAVFFLTFPLQNISTLLKPDILILQRHAVTVP
jgi:hypothetical protein